MQISYLHKTQQLPPHSGRPLSLPALISNQSMCTEKLCYTRDSREPEGDTRHEMSTWSGNLYVRSQKQAAVTPDIIQLTLANRPIFNTGWIQEMKSQHWTRMRWSHSIKGIWEGLATKAVVRKPVRVLGGGLCWAKALSSLFRDLQQSCLLVGKHLVWDRVSKSQEYHPYTLPSPTSSLWQPTSLPSSFPPPSPISTWYKTAFLLFWD